MNQFLARGFWAAGLLCGVLLDVRAAEPSAQVVFTDLFRGTWQQGWSWEREDKNCWRVGPAGLEVRVQPGNMWGPANNAKNVLVRGIPSPDTSIIEISTMISNRPTAQWEQANLVWYYDGGNMVKLGQELVTGRFSIVMGREQNDQARTVAIVPLDDYRVELRLQGYQNRVRGQFRTAARPIWQDVGECELPVKGGPKVSLHFYNGPANEEHWVRVSQCSVRQLPADGIVWTRPKVEERVLSGKENPSVPGWRIGLPGNMTLFGDGTALKSEANANFEIGAHRFADGAYGWRWDRRSSASKQPLEIGVGQMPKTAEPIIPQGDFDPIPLAQLKSLELETDGVMRLEGDGGNHNLAVRMQLASHQGERHVVIWLDWYGPGSEVGTLRDGNREYGLVPSAEPKGEMQYRIRGLRGIPPHLNLKVFLDDAVKHGLEPDAALRGVWLSNQVWDGSRGGMLVTKMDWVINGRRYSSVPSPAAR